MFYRLLQIWQFFSCSNFRSNLPTGSIICTEVLILEVSRSVVLGCESDMFWRVLCGRYLGQLLQKATSSCRAGIGDVCLLMRFLVLVATFDELNISSNSKVCNFLEVVGVQTAKWYLSLSWLTFAVSCILILLKKVYDC